MAFAEEIKAAIALVGAEERDPVVDFLLDPGAAGRALDALPEHGGLVIRVAPAAAEAASGHGPKPVDPRWIRVMRGAREVGTALYRGGDGMVRKAAKIELEEREEPCCDAPGCDRRRAHAAVWFVLEPAAGGPDRLLVAEQRAGEGAPEIARGLAARLAKALDVPLERGGEVVTVAESELPAPLGDALPPAELARFAIRTEGERYVLRDWDSRGPRASAARNAWIGAALMIVAVACWAALVRALRDPAASQGAAVGAGMAASLFTLAGYAFLGVARFSSKYEARSAPLCAVGKDRLIVLPWVSRDGAVDARPEGRLGAAIPLVEVRSASPSPSARGVAVRLDTDHGPFDVLVCANEAAAKVWCAALDRAVDEMRHPRTGATARQRARARAQAA